MGHIRLGTLPRSKKWREVVGLLEAEASVEEIAGAAADASERDLSRASDDPLFQFVSALMVRLPLLARAPGFEVELAKLGIAADSLHSLPAFLAGLNDAIDRCAINVGRTTDAGALAKAALVESLAVALEERLPSLFDPTPSEIRGALASYSSGQGFAALARDFFARLAYRSLDYYLSRELAAHTGDEHRFGSDVDRVNFERALAQHTVEASRIVKEFAAGWYGKTIWQNQTLDQDAINGFTRYAFKKMRQEFGRRRVDA